MVFGQIAIDLSTLHFSGELDFAYLDADVYYFVFPQKNSSKIVTFHFFTHLYSKKEI